MAQFFSPISYWKQFRYRLISTIWMEKVELQFKIYGRNYYKNSKIYLMSLVGLKWILLQTNILLCKNMISPRFSKVKLWWSPIVYNEPYLQQYYLVSKLDHRGKNILQSWMQEEDKSIHVVIGLVMKDRVIGVYKF